MKVKDLMTQDPVVLGPEATLEEAARRILEEGKKRVRITEKDLEAYLGPPRFLPETEAREPQVGVATGMYYTPVGGDIMFVEVSVMPGKGNLILTGQLGDVMKESARAALSYAKKNALRFGIPLEKFDKSDIHIHVPAGAIPKEGPSAGVALVSALVSALTEVPVRHDIAMTGEITLRGEVLPIGGLKEKLLAAHRGGITTVLIPVDNQKDLVEIPDNIKGNLTIKPVKWIDEVLAIALAEQPKPAIEVAAGLARRSGASLLDQFLYGYALAADGAAGVQRMLEIMETEIYTTMGLLGATKFSELNPSFIHSGALATNAPHVFSAFPLLHLGDSGY